MVEPEDNSGAVSRSDCRQTSAEYAVRGAHPCRADSAVCDCSGLQPGCRYSADLDAAVCHGGVAGFPAKSVWEAEYAGADSGFDRSALSEDLCFVIFGNAAGCSGACDCGTGATFGSPVCVDCVSEDERSAGA